MLNCKRFKDPIYGYIDIEQKIISEIVDTAGFQRLRNIIQTSITQIKLLIVSVSGIMNLINTFYGGQLCQHYLIV